MRCYSPLTAFQPLDGGPLKFGKEPPNHREIQIRCGQCIGCRLNKSQQWATRCVHEAQLHAENCFITLTYEDKELPEFGSLHKPHLQRFIKRLRKERGSLRYYACGEYGDLTQRAHYHACLFGIDFHDKIPYRKLGEHTLYMSDQLTRIWGHGHTSVGSLTYETAAYTARYVTKKLTKGQHKYVRLDEQTGELIPLVQPFAAMSLRPAIAKEWLLKHHQDIYSHDKDEIHVRGKPQRPATYYDKLYDSINPEHLAIIKAQRQLKDDKITPQQLRAREKHTHARTLMRKQI